MAQGKVLVNNLNLAQGEFPEIERKALFIGVGTKNNGSFLSVNTQTDLEDALGVNGSEIKDNVAAAKLNGGENWFCYAAPQTAGYVLADVVHEAMATVSPEIIAICTPIADKAELEAINALAEILRTQYARRVIMLAATPGIEALETWPAYETAQLALVAGVAASRTGAVPQLHGNNLGVLVGRLCNHAVSVADTPMRVATGPVLGLGAEPTDTNGDVLSGATLTSLDAARLSCPQSYTDYPGVYWGDCNLLDAPGGDYQVIENLRPVDKAARAIRVLAIQRVGNRSLNSTPASIAANKTYFMRVLREMSHSTMFAGTHFPGDIQPPKDDAITITWPTRTKVEIFIKVQPYNCPKEITVNLILDLSGA